MSDLTLFLVTWLSGLWIGIGVSSLEHTGAGWVLVVGGVVLIGSVIWERRGKCL